MNKQLKSILGSLLFIGAVAIAPTADAGFNIGNQKIVSIVMANPVTTGTAYAFVEFDGDRVATPACSGNGQNRRYIFDTTTSRGKATLSLLTAAMYAQRPVYATGTNACSSGIFGQGASISLENLQSITAHR